jgi:hypothetical protein
VSTYRLFPSTNGPSAATSYSGNFLAGVAFEVTQGGCWFEGYWWWVGDGSPAQPTASQTFALWNARSQDDGDLISGSVVTSGALTAGQWNYVPLETPVQLAIGTTYIASTGVNGNFPVTNYQFNQGGPYEAGIIAGPLAAYSDQGASLPASYNLPQSVFTTANSDPTAVMANGGSESANFWMDLQVSDTEPAGYAGSRRLWPNKFDASPTTSADSPANYVVATEIHLSQACTLDNIWYYSPGGTSQLATECGVWDIDNRQLVASNTSPMWSGPPASGWVSCAFTGVILSAGRYRVAVYNGAATPDGWSPKQVHYWDTGVGQNGITNGPLSAPQLADAATAVIYQGSGEEPGQSVFAVGPPNQFPDLYVDGLAQNYWVDAEVTPTSASIVNPSAFLSFFP